MDQLYIGYLGVIVLISMILLKVPVAYALASVGTAGMIYLYGFKSAMLFIPPQIYSYSSSFSFAALPLFLFMGYIAFYADLSKDSYDAARAWLGKVPGGLAVATVFASAIFGACCGSGLVEAAVFSKICIPEMLKSGYNKRLSLGVLASASGIDALIPPSVLFVIYGVLTETSIGQLLMAGILPGLLYATVFAVAIIMWCYFKPSYAPRSTSFDTSWQTRLRTLRRIWAVFILFSLVLGSIYLGWATPDEAAGVGVVGSLLLLLYRGKFNWANLMGAAIDSAKTSAMIFLIMGAATIFSAFMSVTGVIGQATDFIIQLNLPFGFLIAVLMVLYLVLGCLFDPVSNMVLTLPVVIPILKTNGASLVWFGVVYTMLCCIGGVTPPFGINCFVMKGALGDLVELRDIFAGAAPFVALMILIVAILCVFPQISLWIPSQMAGF